MDWTQIFTTTFQVNFSSEFQGVMDQFIGHRAASGSFFDQAGILVPFVLYSLAIVVVARILTMIRGVSSDHVDDGAGGSAQAHQEWRDD